MILNIQRKSLILAIIIIFLVFGNIFLGINYFLNCRELSETEKRIETIRVNGKVVNFMQMFVEKVLKAESEISFENRLKLENAVRDLGDKKVLSDWENFTASKTEAEAQENVKNLLDTLVKKIKY